MNQEEKEKRKQEILADIMAEREKSQKEMPLISGNKSAMKELGAEDWAEAAQDELEDWIEQQGIYLRQ